MLRTIAAGSILLSLVAGALLASPAAATHCGTSIVSDASTQWTHAEVGETSGSTASAVVPTHSSLWVDIAPRAAGQAEPRYIYKSAAAHQDETDNAVVFTRAFGTCGVNALDTGVLNINADNAFKAYVNGVLAAECGTPGPVGPGVGDRCFDRVLVKPVTLSVENVLVVQVWNQVHPDPNVLNHAMLQYRIDL